MTDHDSASPAPSRKPSTGNAKCKVCSHAQRGEIEAMMARGVGKRTTAKRLNVSPDSVQRHWQRHCPESVKVAHRVKWAAPKADLDKLTMAEAEGVLTYLQRLRADLLTLFEAAKAYGHYASVAAISRELRGVLEMTAKISGELNQTSKKASVINVALSPDYLDLRGRLVRALRRFPDATAAVMAEFRVTESKAEAAMTAPLMIEAQTSEALRVPCA